MLSELEFWKEHWNILGQFCLQFLYVSVGWQSYHFEQKLGFWLLATNYFEEATDSFDRPDADRDSFSEEAPHFNPYKHMFYPTLDPHGGCVLFLNHR